MEGGNDKAARCAAKQFDLRNSRPVSREAALDSVAKRTGIEVHRLKMIDTHKALITAAARPSSSTSEWRHSHTQFSFELRDNAEGGGSCLVRMWGASGEDLAQSDVCEVAVLEEPTACIAIDFEGAEHELRISLLATVDTLKDERWKCAPLQKT
eukprot:CAMPEP_0180035712 /NCGR_PEP_ID=MMETSP0984-20121128/30453_1 /TAXON_ID=483367 /ORGANISM="non described non described, Strain CCMP 2436" /LENGTH=153 /DNA_ID=CAMNT_0021961665 /DNA_START=77 /DNA_END=536 /DNA_ORIENTATION=-